MSKDPLGLAWDLQPGPPLPPRNARIAVVHGRELISLSAEFWQPPELTQLQQHWPLGEDFSGALSLGRIEQQWWYMMEWPRAELPSAWVTINARMVLAESEIAFAIASRATQMAIWRQQHRYCGQCGSPTEQPQREHFRFCKPCGLRFYPRINPCVIVLVTRGNEVLLAQSVRHRHRGWFSTLAGFMEPGESAEQAVRREVFEEVGVQLRNLRYLTSQTWPFPNQLMLGFIAEYDSGDIRIQETEIAQAGWFDLAHLPQHPPAQTISGHLIRQYQIERGFA